MDKAIIIGGSNGIGLAITKNLIDKGYHVDILDKHNPDEGVIPEGKYVRNLALKEIRFVKMKLLRR